MADNLSKSGKWKRRLLRILLILLALTAVQVIRDTYLDEEKQVRMNVREFINGQFPDQSAKLKADYGLEEYRIDSSPVSPGQGERHVVIIHGLDDPGKVWMNLAPRLSRAGFRVWIMTYPNDQPIVGSAQLFLRELEALKKRGIDSIDVVAHSMGGLVTRETITNPEWRFEKKVRDGLVPNLSRFIMVGTPNHGSQLARFRLLAEFRDQLVNLFDRDYHWLRPIVDGAGEAGIDLLPGSRFLEELNGRPRPKGVEMMVIAGRLTHWREEDIERFIDSARQKLPEAADNTLEELAHRLKSMSDGVGDGLVTIESARLNDVPMRIVSGSHLSIIRNLTADNPREPPSIPIILDVLSQSPGNGVQGSEADQALSLS